MRVWSKRCPWSSTNSRSCRSRRRGRRPARPRRANRRRIRPTSSGCSPRSARARRACGRTDGEHVPGASAFVAASPTVNIGGEDKPDLSSQLLELTVREDTLGLYRCEAEFGNWGSVGGRIGFRYFDRAMLDFGKAFKVKLGDTVLFDGRIMRLHAVFPEGAPPRIQVLADDRLQDLRMTRRTRTFTDQSDADAMRTIASDHSLTGDIDASGPTHKVLAQVNQSDLAFVR